MSLFVLFNKGQPVHVTDRNPIKNGAFQIFPNQIFPNKHCYGYLEYDSVKGPWDFTSYDEVVGLALKLTAMTGTIYLGFDAGESTTPQFGVFTPPKVGDEVSYGFNGDYYPAGKVTKITPNWRVYTEDAVGRKRAFNRKQSTTNWTMVGGTWSLVQGTHEERNPSY